MTENVQSMIDAALDAARRHGQGAVRIYLSIERQAQLMRNVAPSPSASSQMKTYRGVSLSTTMEGQIDRVITANGDAVRIEATA